MYDGDEERFVPRPETRAETKNKPETKTSNYDEETSVVSENCLWERFKKYLASENPRLDVNKILERTVMKKEPIISYGVIEFVVCEAPSDKPAEGKILYHMFRRRNTLEFDTTIRGFAPKNQLYQMIYLLSKDERERILTAEWEDIWDDYFLDHDQEGPYTKLKTQAMRRFSELRDLVSITKQSEDIDGTILPIQSRPYIFAKGRAHKGESGLDAALRESAEETKVPYSRDDLYFQSPIIQHYTGSDGNRYIDHYYVIKRDRTYSSPVQYLSPVKRYISNYTNNTGSLSIVERLRPMTISHELESDIWIPIPIFNSKKDNWEWQNNVQPYKEYGIFKRHFNALLQLHSHLA